MKKEFLTGLFFSTFSSISTDMIKSSKNIIGIKKLRYELKYSIISKGIENILNKNDMIDGVWEEMGKIVILGVFNAYDE